jgi:hypothetical protein
VLGGRNCHVPAPLKITADVAICTIASGAAGRPGDQRPRSTM